MQIKNFLLYFFLVFFITACKQYKFVIVDSKEIKQDTCIFYFYPANQNAIEWLNYDTNKKNIIYSFEEKCNKYVDGYIVTFKGKNKIKF